MITPRKNPVSTSRRHFDAKISKSPSHASHELKVIFGGEGFHKRQMAATSDISSSDPAAKGLGGQFLTCRVLYMKMKITPVRTRRKRNYTAERRVCESYI